MTAMRNRATRARLRKILRLIQTIATSTSGATT